MARMHSRRLTMLFGLLVFVIIVVLFSIAIYHFKRSDDPHGQSVAPSLKLAHVAQTETGQAQTTDALTIGAGVTLSWFNVSIDVVPFFSAPKRILAEAYGEARPGELVAIMGPSGCGKSSLLNALSGRFVSGKVFGRILANGEERKVSSWRDTLAYVEQINTLNPTFTVRKTLKDMALLKLSCSDEEICEKIEGIIEILQLDTCADSTVEVISGGQKKRLAIGLELISSPQLLFLDEPTSGLDSTLSYQLVETIQEIAVKYQKTIIMTLHQPREDALRLISKVMLLSQGSQVFFGTIEDGVKFFTSNGIENTRNVNVADFFLDSISLDKRSAARKQESIERIERLISAWKMVNFASLFAPGPFPHIPEGRGSPISPWRQFNILMNYQISSLSLGAFGSMFFGVTIYLVANYFLDVYKFHPYFALTLALIFSNLSVKIRMYKSLVISSRYSNLYIPLIYLLAEVLVNAFIYVVLLVGIYFLALWVKVYTKKIPFQYMASDESFQRLATQLIAMFYYLFYCIFLSYLVHSEILFGVLNMMSLFLFILDNDDTFKLLKFLGIPVLRAVQNALVFMSLMKHATLAYHSIPSRMILTRSSQLHWTQKLAIYWNRFLLSRPAEVTYNNIFPNCNFQDWPTGIAHMGIQCSIFAALMVCSFLYSTIPPMNLETYSP